MTQPTHSLTLDPSTFEYLKPTANQLTAMAVIRQKSAEYAHALETVLPDGPDKTYVLRQLRGLAMWANVAITRHPDGAPRVVGKYEEMP